MNKLKSRTIGRLTFHLIAILGVAACLSVSTHAQRRVPISENERNERDLAEREFLLRTLGKFKKKDLEVGQRPINLQQLKRDFEGLQLANNKILAVLSAKRSITYAEVGADVAAIRRRASALKAQLLLPTSDTNADQPNQQREIGSSDETLKNVLLQLDSLIVRFVNNPIFKASGMVVDVQYSAQAYNDLNDMIHLCDRIKKSAALENGETPQ